MALEKCK